MEYKYIEKHNTAKETRLGKHSFCLFVFIFFYLAQAKLHQQNQNWKLKQKKKVVRQFSNITLLKNILNLTGNPLHVKI